MPQTARKPASQSPVKPVFPKAHVVSGAAKTAQDTQAAVLGMGRDNVENLMRATDDYNRMTAEFLTICSENLKALAESGSIATRAAQNVNGEIADICSHSFSEAIEVSKDAFGCRTVNDITELHTKAMQRAIAHYFERVNRISDMLFNCCDETMEPFHERTAIASEQIRRALAG